MFLLLLLPIVFALLLAFGVFPYSIAWIPVLMCGEISLAQLIKVIKQKEFLFNVYFYVWTFTIINTFVSPCIHLFRNEWAIMAWRQPNDWIPYAFVISMMNLTGIILWSFMLKDNTVITPKKSNRILKPNWRWIMIAFMLVSLAAQLYVYYLSGGIRGYILNFSENSEFFEGMGLFFIISESFPYMFLLFVLLSKKTRLKQWQFFLLILVLFIITIFFGGLRGSRSNTILFIVIAVVALNVYLYRIRSSDIVILLIGFFVFMYIGRLYKDYGIDIMESNPEYAARFNMTATELVITGDLSRYSVNAYELYRLEKDPGSDVFSSFHKAYGETYLWGILRFIPGGGYIINSFGLVSRTHYASALFYGSIDNRKSSRILGPIGEWFINFGYYTFFIPYIILGYLFRYLRKITRRIPKDDIMFLVVPPILTWLPQLVLSDASNIMFFFMKRVVIIWLVLRIITNKVVIRQQ